MKYPMWARRRLPLISLGLILTTTAAVQAGYVLSWGDNDSNQQARPALTNQFKAIAAGWRHTLGLRADGTVASWGYDSGGATNVPSALTGVAGIAAGSGYSLALKTDGTVVGWGAYGTDLQVAGLSNVTAISAGWYHWLALRQDGTLAQWQAPGANVPPLPSGLRQVTAIAAGLNFSLALQANGRVTAWGSNDFGQLELPSGLANITAIAAGYSHALALSADGRVSAWGLNAAGETTVPAGLSNVVAIAAGNQFSVALQADGKIVAWGNNTVGQRNVPDAAQVIAITAGERHAVALTLEGPVIIVRSPTNQQALPGTQVEFSVEASGRKPLTYQWYFNGSQPDYKIPGATNAVLTLPSVQSNAAGVYLVAVRNAFGEVFSGRAFLTLGIPPEITQSPASATVPAGSNFSLTVSATGTAPLSYQWLFYGTNLPGKTGAVLSFPNIQTANSGVYAVLVSNAYGVALSSNATITVTDSLPYNLSLLRQENQGPGLYQPVPLGTFMRVSVSAKGSLPFRYQWRLNGDDLPGATNATLSLGPLRLDQDGYYSVAVRNAVGESVSPKMFVDVMQTFAWEPNNRTVLTNTPANASNTVALAAGSYHVLALQANGRVLSWGQLSGSTLSGATNVPASATNVIAVAAGGDFSLALRSNGTVVAWGSNLFGQTNVPTGLSNVVGIATGGDHAVAVRADGRVTAWGNNKQGQASPPQTLSNVVGVAAGSSFSLALKTDGTVSGWGDNTYGQLNPPPTATNVIAVEANGLTALALRADGRVLAWGQIPTSINDSLTNVVAMAMGNRFHALRADGRSYSLPGVAQGSSTQLSNVIALADGKRGNFTTFAHNLGMPFFTLHPARQNLTRSNTVAFHARAVGRPPMHYQWQRNGENISGATNADLVFAGSPLDQGVYQCVARNALGTSVSRPGTVAFADNTYTLPEALNATNLVWANYSTPAQSPGWAAQTGESHDQVAAAQTVSLTNGQIATLRATVNGPGTLSFWWKVSSEEDYDALSLYLDKTTTPIAQISGETGWQQFSLNIPQGSHSVFWNYAKDVSLSDGQDAAWVDEVSFTGELPVIGRQPVSRRARVGETVVIPAIVISPTPVSYQWLKAGTNLPGATQQYLTLTNITLSDAGIYALRAANTWGSVVSSNATLTVLPAPGVNAAAPLSDGSVQVQFPGIAGRNAEPGDLSRIQVQVSSNLVDWIPLPAALTATNCVLSLRDTNAAHFPRRFYRVVEQP